MSATEQTLAVRWNPNLDDGLLDNLMETWVDATNDGGALGFLPPVTPDDINVVGQRTFGRVDQGLDDLLVASLDGVTVGWLLLERDPRSFAAHWRTVKRLQVHPNHQGRGIGRSLMLEASRYASDVLRLEFLLLTARDGTGIDGLYRSLGYDEVGRVPGAMRVGPGDDRDEIFMVLRLT